MEAFLKYYVASKRLRKKPEFRPAMPGRKGSKSSLLSSDSNSSLGNQEDGSGLSGLSYTVAQTLRKAASSHLSPIPSESGVAGEFLYDADNDGSSNCKPALRHLARGNGASGAPRSTSPGKSVSISEHVTIMADRPSSGNGSEIQNDSVSVTEESWGEQEDVQLLGQHTSQAERVKEVAHKTGHQRSLPLGSFTACEAVVHHMHNDDPTSPLLEESTNFGDTSLQMLSLQTNH